MFSRPFIAGCEQPLKEKGTVFLFLFSFPPRILIYTNNMVPPPSIYNMKLQEGNWGCGEKSASLMS